MTREEFRKIVYIMKSIYTQETFIPDQASFNIWFGFLKDLSAEDATQAVQKHILTSHFPPTIADIRSGAAQLQIPVDEDLTDLAAWALVSHAVRNSSYHAEQEFSALPPLVQKAIGSANLLKSWAAMDPESVETVVQSSFLRAYRTEQKRARADACLPAHMRLQGKKRREITRDR